MPDSITIAAASSLADVFPQIGEAFARQNRGAIVPRFSFAASGTIARQIVAGAPIDLFAAVGDKEMNDLTKVRLLVTGTHTVFAANHLVLIQSQTSRIPLRDWRDLATLPPNARVVIGNPDTVPAGRFAHDVLTKRGLWNPLQAQRRLVLVGSVRQALDAATSGNADAAVVFSTDAHAGGNRVRLISRAIPGKDHTPILYSAALIQGTSHESGARSFLQFLTGPIAQRILLTAGFVKV